ncbi:MAG: glycosyltransferase family 2 protein [Hyphomicrobiales bacterium]
MRRLDRRSLTVAADEILSFARIRNENLRLPRWLDNQRKLGVHRFFIVDNRSVDGSTEYLLEQDDVHLFWTDESFAANRSGMNWINCLLNEHGCDHWTLTTDADELLIYPEYERVNLVRLTAFLARSGADALQCVLLDMHSDCAIKDTRYVRGSDFLERCPYFDREPPRDHRGGLRGRLFWNKEIGDPKLFWNEQTSRLIPSPYLGKVPLVRWSAGLSYAASTHFIRGLTPSSVSGALLHFKMFSDFAEKVRDAVEEKQYWNNSAEYAIYKASLDADPNQTAFGAHSERFRDSAQLAELGFISSSPDYDQFVASTVPN